MTARRHELALALLEYALPAAPDSTRTWLAREGLLRCSDADVDQFFCAPEVLAAVADGLLTPSQAALFMDANLIAWELVDRPPWLDWP